jgi:hypothetical protein
MRTTRIVVHAFVSNAEVTLKDAKDSRLSDENAGPEMPRSSCSSNRRERRSGHHWVPFVVIAASWLGNE